MSVEQIGDHMAFACDCGCVRFNLLKSGSIKCDDCGSKVEGLSWGDSTINSKRYERLRSRTWRK